MSYATIVGMEYRCVDTLQPDQIEVGDYIGIHGSIVHVIDIMDSEHGYTIVHEDEFGETDFTEIPDDLSVSLYVFDD